jgi:mannose-6-phosphate isomerase class I
VLLFPVEGNFSLEWENGSVFVATGEVVLIPNIIDKVNIKAQNCKVLEIYINK